MGNFTIAREKPSVPGTKELTLTLNVVKPNMRLHTIRFAASVFLLWSTCIAAQEINFETECETDLSVGDVLGAGDSTIDEVSAAANKAQQSNDLVESLQNWRGENKLANIAKAGTFKEESEAYRNNLATYAVTGIFFGVVTIIWCSSTACCRLCGRCYTPKKHIKDYSRKERLIPIGCYFLWAIPATICAIAGLVYV